MEWPGPVVLIEDDAPGADTGAFVGLRLGPAKSEIAGQLFEGANEHGVIVKLDDDANAVWVHEIPVALVRVAGAPGGGVNFTGTLRAGFSPDLGGGPITTTATSESFVLTQLDRTGKHVFSVTPDCADYCEPSSIATDPASGNIAVGGFVRGTMSIDGQSIDGSAGGANRLAWIGVFGPNGKAKWLKAFAPGGNVPGLHFDGEGRLIALGYFSAEATIDTLPLHAGKADTGFLAGLQGEDGKALWANTFGGNRPTYLFELAGNGDQVILPMYRFDLADDSVMGAYRAGDGIAVTTYSTRTGKTMWSTNASDGVWTALGPSGRAELVGTAAKTVVLDDSMLSVAIDHDFVAGLDDAGHLAWFHDLGPKAMDGSVVLTTRTGRTLVVQLPTLPDAGGNSVSLTALTGG